jgi:hypothetical protein
MSVLARLACVAFLFLLPEAALGVAPPHEEGVLEEFPFDNDGGEIIVPLTLKGKSYPFLLDTGSTMSIFDDSLLTPDTRTEAVTPGGRTGLSLAPAPAAFVGRLPFPRNSRVGVHSLFREEREKHGLKIWGFLGMDFLADYAVRIDFDQGWVAFLRPGRPVRGHRLPLTWLRSTPHVQARVFRGEPIWFLIDTGKLGAGSGILDSVSCRTAQHQGKLKSAGQVASTTAAGTRTRSIGWLNSLKIGPFEHTRLNFMEGMEGCGSSLGLDFWSRYQVTFDFPTKCVYLRKSSRHSAADRIDGSGLRILLNKGRAFVVDVADRSPAAKAGIRKGDEVVSIAGRKAAGANMTVLRRLLYGEGRTVRLVLQRGEKKREVPLRLDIAWRTEKVKR